LAVAPFERMPDVRLLWVFWTVLLASPAAASGATVAIGPGQYENGDEVVYHAADGEANVLTVLYTDPDEDGRGVWRFTDLTGVSAGEGCIQVDAQRATCSQPDTERHLEGVRIAVSDGDDRVSVDSDTQDSGSNVLLADGGPGDDRLRVGSNAYARVTGGDGNDRLSAARKVSEGGSGAFLSGGPGDDRLIGSGFDDELHGGGGRDELYGRGGPDRLIDGDTSESGPGPDLLHGGTNDDAVLYSSRSRGVVVDLASRGPQGEPGENDTVVDVESAAGGKGPDRLLGDRVANGLSGGGGDDSLDGRAGNDQLTPGRGSNAVRCGSGRDDVDQVRRTTLIPRDCEELSWGDTSYRPYPRRVVGGRLTYEVMCPFAVTDGDTARPCRGAVRLTEAAEPRRRIASAPIARSRWGWVGGGRAVEVPLTEVGRRLAGRRNGVVVTVHFRFRKGKGLAAGGFSWRIRLALGRTGLR
jgi:hypothetical protein